MFLPSMEEKSYCVDEGLEEKGRAVNSTNQLRNCVHGGLVNQVCVINVHRTACFHRCLQSRVVA